MSSPKEKKQIAYLAKLQILAGKANPAPPVGTILGPKGVNMMEFCRAFNDQTSSMGDVVVPVEITIYKDKSFTFVLKKPPVSFLIKRELKLDKGSTEPGKKIVKQISMPQVRKIAELKMSDLNCYDLDHAASMVVGAARSMGIEVVND